METIYRFSLRLAPISLAEKCLQPRTITPIFRKTRIHFSNPGPLNPEQAFNTHFPTRKSYSSGSSPVAKAGWVLGLGEKKKSTSLPDIVKAGDPVLHEPAQDVEPGDIGSERIQKIIDDMVKVMRKAPGVGLAAPQIGIPLRVSFGVFSNKMVPRTFRTVENLDLPLAEGCPKLGGR
ncbi:peptide deformylase 1A, chloroplastic/mitochondrial-like [Prunus avium]|uniref:Peptide deformylase n=1 Tax=Prunus avium TaxID=42229 RepID=A0A6P5RXZ5_PRUAV|nr:peptide deformylase 1A, chloroplastic/mitochondrial-like [Prunus avium]